MMCPCCQCETKSVVKETRLRDGDIVRRRECAECGGQYGTRERLDTELRMGHYTGRKYIRKTPKPEPSTSSNALFGVWKK